VKYEEIIPKLKGLISIAKKQGALPAAKRREIIEGLSVLAREDIPLYLLIELRQIQLKFDVWSRLSPVDRGFLLKRLASLLSKLERYFDEKSRKSVPTPSDFVRRFLKERAFSQASNGPEQDQ